MNKKIYVSNLIVIYSLGIVSIVVSGCAHVSEYSQGCRDGVKTLEPQLGAVGAALEDGDVVDRYCDAIEARHNKKEKNKQ